MRAAEDHALPHARESTQRQELHQPRGRGGSSNSEHHTDQPKKQDREGPVLQGGQARDDERRNTHTGELRRHDVAEDIIRDLKAPANGAAEQLQHI